jgi:micrococcal nuclease
MEFRSALERVWWPAAIAGVGVGVAALVGCAESGTSSEDAALHDVVEVVDGDTVKIDYEGRTEAIRLIGIDTPETVHPNQPVECFGREASEHARELLEGESVAFRPDENKDTRDRYGRLLGYIFFEDGRNFGEVMIEDGYAYEYTYQGEEYEFQDQFNMVEQEAREAERGLWAEDTCGGEQTPVEGTTTAPDSSGGDTCEPDQIKGNINREDERIYHEPGGRFYERTEIDLEVGERCFATPEEAEAAGWRPSAG